MKLKQATPGPTGMNGTRLSGSAMIECEMALIAGHAETK
jgi:hypothetical protein